MSPPLFSTVVEALARAVTEGKGTTGGSQSVPATDDIVLCMTDVVV